MVRQFFGGIIAFILVGAGLLALAVELPNPVVTQPEGPLSPVYGLSTASVLEGTASWYGPGFHGRLTADGTIYNRYALTAAHRTLRHGTVVRVTNTENGRSTVLVINDWGPVPRDRIIDVSEAAAHVLGFHDQGLAQVRVEVLRAANGSR